MSLLDQETLESVVYERSKIWSNYFATLEEIKDGPELDLEDFEEIYQDEDDDANISAEEALEDKGVVEDLAMPNVSTCMTHTELNQILCSGGKNDEMQEILNQTLPVLEEHRRKWKEAGLDRVLNTFDAQKIEQHVGQWLRRHNSVYMDKEKSPPAVSASDNESMHSVDTARYIKQSRQRTPSAYASSNMTTIKMYRTLPHKRDELRAKYAHDDEQEHRRHLQALLRRRKERKMEVTYHHSPRHYSCISKRKHLRKRRYHSTHYQSTSSEEEDCTYLGCDCKSCLKRALSRTNWQCCTYRSHRHHEMMYPRRRQLEYDEDGRPRLRESECNCCNSDKLCSNVVHIANTSTEEWIVENSSPLELERPRKLKNHQLLLVKKTPKRGQSYKSDSESLDELQLESHGKSRIPKKVPHGRARLIESPSSSDSEAKQELVETKTPKLDLNKAKQPSTSIRKKTQTIPKLKESDAVDKDQAKPIDSLPKSLQSKSKIGKKKPNSLSPKSKPSKPIKKTSSKVNTNMSNDSEDESEDDDQLQRALALSKQTYEKELTKRQPKLPEPTTTTQILFNNQSVACNSTALVNDTACARSLVTKQSTKRAAVSTTSSGSSMDQPTPKKKGNEADCTIVTSTTCHEPAEPKLSPIKITNKGILLHSSNNGNFTLTEQHLCKIIGPRRARKYLQYHMGSRSFDQRHSVYYRPTPKLAAALTLQNSTHKELSSSSSSEEEDDIFDRIQRYGLVYSVLEKS